MDGKGNSETLKADIRKIRLSELESFVQSKTFMQLPYVPITPARARSYLENPHGLPDDIVVIMAYMDGQMIAFRSLYAGVVQPEKERVRFGWCSGSWVHPDFRRKGISLRLLKEAYHDWNGRLMFTNYAPESENLYLKTGWFHEIHKYEGARGYLFVGKERLKLLTRKKKVPAFLFAMGSLFTDLIAGMRVLAYHQKIKSILQFEELNFPDSKCFEFLQNDPGNYLFLREEKDWNWIFRFPWITDSNSEIKRKYPFSSVSGNFYYRTIKVQQDGMLTGLFIFSVREGHLKTLCFHLKPGIEKDVAGFIRKFAAREKLEMVTVYHSEIAHYLLQDKSPFLYVKPYGQKIYSTFPPEKTNRYLYRDGEGDYVLT
jgi:GNAT superfamily N-acetyltransferase